MCSSDLFDPYAAGVQKTTFNLGKYFTEQGFEVGYFSTKENGHKKVEYGKLFPAPSKGDLRQAKNRKYLEKTLENWRPDVVINQMPYENTLRYMLYKNKKKWNYVLLGCLNNSIFSFLNNVRHKTKIKLSSFAFRLVGNQLGLAIIKKYHFYRHRKKLKSILVQHDRFILLTPQNKEELKYFVGEHLLHRTEVIPNSIPKVYPDAAYKKSKKFLFVGSLNVEQKRADLLLRFWEKIYNEIPDWEFIIVGDGPERKVIANEIIINHVAKVQIKGHQKPEEYYREASLFIMTSAYEGLPNTILEAQSYGCPVLAFDSYRALRWIVNDGKDALLSPPFDTAHMAHQAIEIINNKERLHFMQKMAIENAKRFTIDKVGQKWLNLFDEMGIKSE